MSFVSFEHIVELIDSTEPQSGGMKVYFKCPMTGHVVEARGSYPDSGRRRFAQVATGSMARALLHRLSGLIRQYTGFYIPLGNAVQTQDVPGAGSGFVNEADRQAAAIAAFQTVAQYPGKPVKPGCFNHVDGQWIFVK